MNKIKVFAAILAVVASISTANAQFQIDFGSGNRIFRDTNGTTALQTGDRVLIGNFNLAALNGGAGFQLDDTFAELNAAFTTFASADMGLSFNAISGMYDPAPAPGRFFDSELTSSSIGATGQQLYMWVFNDSNPLLATGWIILTNNLGAWVRPADGQNTSINSTTGTFVPAGAIGTYLTPTVGGSSIVLGTAGVIPEPSTYLMGVLGLAALAAARRRQRK